jgi:hypothetical protein
VFVNETKGNKKKSIKRGKQVIQMVASWSVARSPGCIALHSIRSIYQVLHRRRTNFMVAISCRAEDRIGPCTTGSNRPGSHLIELGGWQSCSVTRRVQCNLLGASSVSPLSLRVITQQGEGISSDGLQSDLNPFRGRVDLRCCDRRLTCSYPRVVHYPGMTSLASLSSIRNSRICTDHA